ncbi:hypothetical protein GLV94_18695 [Virgibacillus halodenitrificans]|uniref:hypothetical protein n=1 Tax=Virgibacillus halodenitrificans TaxID=1482 RepID=UPI00136C549A|nr:hypothetical protein [Virgibacillus halodenitrificans]MYL47672.1 hypothetical protein [Virgibacillus halodenitrificans]
MDEVVRLTQSDLQGLKTNRDEAIKLVKHYAPQYKGKEHFDKLGASCAMSVCNTVDTIIGSSRYLNGNFVMPDEIHIESLGDWFMENKNYECEKFILNFYIASYIKKKINKLYRSINKTESGLSGISLSFTIMGYKTSREEFEKQINLRRNMGVKLIRQ